MAGAARMEPDSSSASDLVAPLTLLMLAEPQHRHTNRGIMTCGSSFLNTSWVPLLSGCLIGKNGFTSYNSPRREVHFLISRLHRWGRTEAERNWVFYPRSHSMWVTERTVELKHCFLAMPTWRVSVKTRSNKDPCTEKVLCKMLDSFLPAINHVVECSINVIPEQMFCGFNSSWYFLSSQNVLGTGQTDHMFSLMPPATLG